MRRVASQHVDYGRVAVQRVERAVGRRGSPAVLTSVVLRAVCETHEGGGGRGARASPLCDGFARRRHHCESPGERNMLIADATARALENVSARERDLAGVFPQMQMLTPPDAYFVARDENGRLLFTRSDSLFLRTGTLTDANGREILGYRTPGSALSPLRADPVDLALRLP